MFNENHVLRATILLTLAIGLPLLLTRPPIGLGILLGGSITTLAFRLLIIDATKLLAVAKRSTIDPKDARRYNFKSFAKRCLLYSGALIIATKSPYINFLPTLAGLLIPRIAIYYCLLQGRKKHGT